VAEQEVPKSLGKYEVQSVLGRGAMGIVYRGYDPAIERLVAIKVMHEHLFKGEEGNDFAQRFQHEARAAARCWHPNIVAVFDFGTERNVPYLVMELVEGRELRDVIESRRFTMRESIELVTPVLSALHHAHSKGVVHRDIKPANIMVLTDGGVKVADFGIARLDTSDLTRSGYVVGTLGYMSPEGERGDVVDSRSDIYSSAMVLLQLITGRRPHPGYLAGQTVPELIAAAGLTGGQMPALASILETALHTSPEQRFQSAEDFQNALLQWLSGATVSANSQATNVGNAVSAAGGHQTGKGTVSPALLKFLEERLASYVGPMAGHFVRKACRADTDVDSITKELASHIPNRDERSEFVNAVENSDVVSAVRQGSRPNVRIPRSDPGLASPVASAQAPTLSAEQLGRIAAELTYFIGPLAGRLVHAASTRVSSIDDLYRDLATHIPSERDRHTFLERVRTLIPSR
jgi:eukaryotic-like serine/threonine-protein kinase